jgi:hypothetical protein
MVGLRVNRTLPVALALAAALAGHGCGGSDEPSAPERASAAGVTLTPPKGWQVQNRGDHGLVLAPEESGLSPEVPEGPRFTAKTAGGDLPEPRELVGSPPPTGGAGAIRAPARTEVGSRRGVAIQLRERRGGHPLVSRQVTVALGSGRAYSFVLEAPADQWAGSVDTLNGILSTVRFDVAAVPRARGKIPR